ncbi:PD-(D/E)XK nuclease family protein [bacterium]|nr:PD-(D/E)XK nuclease family protein [bacterium]
MQTEDRFFVIQNSLEKLKESPLFMMSLNEKELFHSNFLAWLFSKYPESISYVFELQNTEICKSSMGDPRIKRESYNIDLLIEMGSYCFIIENKIKSSPIKGQLDRYWEKMNNKYPNHECYYFLFSIIPPNFTHKWKWIGYSELIKRISRFVNDINISETYSQLIILDYVDMMNNMLCIIQQYDKHDDYSLFRLSKEETNFLKECRIYDLISKCRFERIIYRLKKRISGKSIIYTDKLTTGNYSDHNTWLKVGFSNGEAILDVKIPKAFIEKHGLLVIGIQVQGNQLRHVLEVFEPKNESSEAILRRIAEDILDENQPFGAKPSKRKDLNRFGNHFFYRYETIDDGTEANILKRIIELIGIIRNLELEQYLQTD